MVEAIEASLALLAGLGELEDDGIRNRFRVTSHWDAVRRDQS